MSDPCGPEWDAVVPFLVNLATQSKVPKIACTRCGAMMFQKTEKLVTHYGVAFSADGTTHTIERCEPRGVQRRVWGERPSRSPKDAMSSLLEDMTHQLPCKKCHNDVRALSSKLSGFFWFFYQPDSPSRVSPKIAFEHDGTPHEKVCIGLKRKPSVLPKLVHATPMVLTLLAVVGLFREAVLHVDAIRATAVHALQALLDFIKN